MGISQPVTRCNELTSLLNAVLYGVLFIILSSPANGGANPDNSTVTSQCFGTTANGALLHGVDLPYKGDNFVGYSRIARLAGRTYVHSSVRDIVLASFQELAKSMPDTVFKYAETGFKDGGQFKPHKSHRNGLSVDFMVPVTNTKGESVHLPTHPFNKFGYNIEFDAQSRYDDYRIDYEALAA